MGVVSKAIALADRYESDEYLSSLYDYCSKAVGNPLMVDQPWRQMCDFFEGALPPEPDKMVGATQQLSMFLGPRNTFKSTIGVNGNAEYFALKWKLKYGYDVRIGIGRSSRELAGRGGLEEVALDELGLALELAHEGSARADGFNDGTRPCQDGRSL